MQTITQTLNRHMYFIMPLLQHKVPWGLKIIGDKETILSAKILTAVIFIGFLKGRSEMIPYIVLGLV